MKEEKKERRKETYDEGKQMKEKKERERMSN